ncbi:ATP-binding cassette domain-containing protein [Nannocystis exedens]|uniref:ATP-binding cassette domain-containing protein n=1 Tax=Nannocystis exedens TaxID=54 RepID=UPI001FE5DE12|nr:ABC transporter ATP-binding protein [Nannocystis exedens]
MAATRVLAEVPAAWALARALTLTAGAEALRRGLPVYVGLLAVGGLLFGGNGLSTATLVEGAETSPLARALLWSAWLIALTPTMAALWQTKSSLWLRSLPAPRAWHLAILFGLSIAAESLWTIVWGLGGGPLAAAGALGGALAGHGVLLARPAGMRGWWIGAAAMTGLLFAPTPVLAVATWPIAVPTLRAAWLAAPTRSAGSRGRSRRLPGPWALALALATSVARGQATVLARGALVMAIATAAAWLAARTNQVRDPAGLQIYLCGFMVPAGLVAGSAVSGPLLRIEQAASWLLRTAGASARLRRGAAVLTLAGLGSGLGAACGAALALATTLSAAPRLVLAGGLAGASLLVSAGLAARWAERFGSRGPGRLVLGLLLAATLALSALAWMPATAVLGWALAVSMVWLIGHARAGSPVTANGGAAVVLEMLGVRKRLGTRIVLGHIDLRCAAGEVVLLLGENGAGKSTLLRIAAGLVEPDRGSVTVAGAALDGGTAGRRALGYAPDTADAFPDLGVRELLALVAAIKRAPLPSPQLCARLGLTAVMDQRMRTLSFGQVKRTYLAAATIGAPPLWILDEPSNGLDPEGGALVATLLHEHAAAGGAALVATNDARFVGLCPGRTVRLMDGALREEGQAGA